VILIRTLGSCDLHAPDRPDASAILSQPKRFGLLVYLAVAAPSGFVRRDTLLALFWPEADQIRGRQVLRQTVYLMRQSLGAEALPGRGGEDVAIDPAAVQCDVTLFEQSLAEGRTAEALEHYRGDFLAGFHVPDASAELNEWIDSERRRLRSLAAAGAWALAGEDERAGNLTGAAYWARRGTRLDPHDERGALRLMQWLARAGDRAGALRVYQEHARRAAEDLGIEPSESLQRLAESLRPGQAGEPTMADAPPAPVAAQMPAPAATADPAAAPQPIHGSPMVSKPPGSPARVSRPWWGWAAAALILVALTGTLLLRGPERSPVVPVLAIGPITDASTGDSSPVSNVPADLLSTSLARLPGVQVIPVTRLYDLQSQLRAAGAAATTVLDAARRSGAGELIQGELTRGADGRFDLALEVIDVTTGQATRHYLARARDVFLAVDEATRVIARSFDVQAPRERIAEVTTSSLVAYRLYEQGLRELYEHGNPRTANRLFLAALAEDSTFAMAAYYVFATRSPTEPDPIGLAASASHLASRAAERERLLILSLTSEALEEPVALAQAETLVARFPAEPDGHFALGVARMRAGDFPGAIAELARVVAMDSMGLRGNVARCRACDAYTSMINAYALADSFDAAERTAREFLRAQPSGSGPRVALGGILVSRGRFQDGLDQFLSADRIAPGTEEDRALVLAVLEIQAGDYAAADRRLLALENASESKRAQALWLLAISLRNQGRLRDALALARRIRFFGVSQDSLRALGNPVQLAQVLFELGRFHEAAALYDTILDRSVYEPWMHGKLARHRAWYLTHVATALAAAGDTARLPALADSIEAFGLGSIYGRDRRLHHHVRGLIERARARFTQAESELRLAVYSWSHGYTRSNLELGSLLLQQNRAAEAVPVLQSALRGPIDASNLYVLRTELHERLAQAFDAAGARDSAAVHYREVARAWRAGDPLFRERAANADTRLKRLAPAR